MGLTACYMHLLLRALRMICSSYGNDRLELHLNLKDHVFPFEISYILPQLVVFAPISSIIYIFSSFTLYRFYMRKDQL